MHMYLYIHIRVDEHIHILLHMQTLSLWHAFTHMRASTRTHTSVMLRLFEWVRSLGVWLKVAHVCLSSLHMLRSLGVWLKVAHVALCIVCLRAGQMRIVLRLPLGLRTGWCA